MNHSKSGTSGALLRSLHRCASDWPLGPSFALEHTLQKAAKQTVEKEATCHILSPCSAEVKSSQKWTVKVLQLHQFNKRSSSHHGLQRMAQSVFPKRTQFGCEGTVLMVFLWYFCYTMGRSMIQCLGCAARLSTGSTAKFRTRLGTHGTDPIILARTCQWVTASLKKKRSCPGCPSIWQPKFSTSGHGVNQNNINYSWLGWGAENNDFMQGPR